MTKSKIIIHAGWAVAVAAAFALGSSRRSDSKTDASANAESAKASRPAAVVGQVRGGNPSSSAARGKGSRSASGSDSSLIERLFGSRPAREGDLEALAQQALRDPNPVTRRLAFSRLLESVTAENALLIRDQLVDAGADGEQWRDFNYAWGALAGQEAFDFAAKSEERDLDAVLTGWASANPTEALALLDNLPEGMRDNRDNLAKSIVSGLADNDQRVATDLVLRLANEGSKNANDLIGIVARETLRMNGPEEAARWTEGLPDGAVKGAAMDRVAEEYAERDSEAAARWAQQFADRDYAARAIGEVADEWAESNPVGAVQWLERLPEGNGQVSGLNRVFGDWEDRDPVAAGEYLLNMPQSAQRDAAISGFSRGYAWQDPQVAIAWAQDIGDPQLRTESLTRAGQVYFRRDPDSARDWLANSGLPADVQEAVLNPPRRRR